MASTISTPSSPRVHQGRPAGCARGATPRRWRGHAAGRCSPFDRRLRGSPRVPRAGSPSTSRRIRTARWFSGRICSTAMNASSTASLPRHGVPAPAGPSSTTSCSSRNGSFQASLRQASQGRHSSIRAQAVVDRIDARLPALDRVQAGVDHDGVSSERAAASKQPIPRPARSMASSGVLRRRGSPAFRVAVGGSLTRGSRSMASSNAFRRRPVPASGRRCDFSSRVCPHPPSGDLCRCGSLSAPLRPSLLPDSGSKPPDRHERRRWQRDSSEQIPRSRPRRCKRRSRSFPS